MGVCILLTCLLGVAIFMNSICCGRLHCCSQQFTPFSIRRFAEWISRSFGRRNMLLCHIVWLATNLFGSVESEWKWQSFQSKNSKKHYVPLPASCSFPLSLEQHAPCRGCSLSLDSRREHNGAELPTGSHQNVAWARNTIWNFKPLRLGLLVTTAKLTAT